MHFKTWVHFNITPSKNAFQNMGALQNCSLKKCISERGCTLKLLPQKMHFKNCHTPKNENKQEKILTDEHKQEIFTDKKGLRFLLMIIDKKIFSQVIMNKKEVFTNKNMLMQINVFKTQHYYK